MLELGGISVALERLDGSEEAELRVVRDAAVRRLRISAKELASLTPRRRSIDARKKDKVHLSYVVDLELRGGQAAERRLLRRFLGRRGAGVLREADDAPLALPGPAAHAPATRPVVVGAGCAGLFCALALASAGLEPVLVERGDSASRRGEAVRRFNSTGALDAESNIQFGAGGAGCFSDGKLATGTKSPLHRLITSVLIEGGASERIAWDAKPHIGSDVLPGVVERICARIRELGGEIRCRCRLTGIELARSSGTELAGGRNRRVAAVTLERRDGGGRLTSERLATETLVLACGHSARDVFELLYELGVPLERKGFAMGVRIEHAQAAVDRAQYGPYAGHPALGAAPYKLSCQLPGGRSAYSFCMCPGGFVVAAASEPGGVVTNGMSLSNRAGANANAGLIVGIAPGELPGEGPLAGVALQRRCEQGAFELGGGGFAAPAQLVGDFLARQPSSAPGAVLPSYPRGVAWGELDACLPPAVTETLRQAIPSMARKLHGFDAPDAVLTGPESRSSSPVRVTRGRDLMSTGVAGLYPAGEGAGYAGGIMSAATDGLRTAQAIIDACQG